MASNVLSIPYPEELLLALKETPDEFESEARLLLDVKLYELGRVSTGMAARIAGTSRVEFILALNRFGLSPIGLEPGELDSDVRNA